MLLKQFIIALVAIISSQVESANILGIFWTPSRSHNIAGSPLLKELAKRGHEVHLLSSFVDKDVNIPTYKQELLEGIIDETHRNMKTNSSLLETVVNFSPTMKILAENFWKNEPVQKLIRTKPKYDAVIVLSFFNDFVLSVGNALDAPVIILSTMGTNVMNSQFLANSNLPYGSHPFIDSSMRSFCGRLATTTLNALFYLIFKYILYPIQMEASKKHLPDMPPIEALNRNVSLMLVNSHFTIEAPRPYIPNMIQIGGYHIQEVNKITGNLGNFLDSAKDGVILFSMGSLLKLADNFKQEQLDVIMNGLAKLAPVKVVFKSEIEFPGAAKNFLISKWLPQNDILAHPNIKLFISHGGLGGITEAVYHGVPLLGIPFFGDQKINIAIAAESGFAIKLGKHDLNQETFDGALKELLNNPKYKANVKKRSSILRNQPVKPMDKAIWWVEHIMEHGGGEHLRNAGMDLEWYQLYMVDIMAFYLFVALISLTLSFFVSKWILIKFCRLLGICKLKEKKVKKTKTN